MWKHLALILLLLPAAHGQSVGAGTIEGSVVCLTGAAMASAQILIHNSVTGYEQKAVSDANGLFKLTNLPPNTYHLEVTAPGFSNFSQEVVIRNSVPVQVKATLALATSKTEVNVKASATEALRNRPLRAYGRRSQRVAEAANRDSRRAG